MRFIQDPAVPAPVFSAVWLWSVRVWARRNRSPLSELASRSRGSRRPPLNQKCLQVSLGRAWFVRARHRSTPRKIVASMSAASWVAERRNSPRTWRCLHRTRLHGVNRPQVFLLGRPREEPINDGVFPLTILRPLDLSDEVVVGATLPSRAASAGVLLRPLRGGEKLLMS